MHNAAWMCRPCHGPFIPFQSLLEILFCRFCQLQCTQPAFGTGEAGTYDPAPYPCFGLVSMRSRIRVDIDDQLFKCRELCVIINQ